MPRRSMNGVRVHVIVTKPQHGRLVGLATRTGLPISELLRRAIDAYLVKDEPQETQKGTHG